MRQTPQSPHSKLCQNRNQKPQPETRKPETRILKLQNKNQSNPRQGSAFWGSLMFVFYTGLHVDKVPSFKTPTPNPQPATPNPQPPISFSNRKPQPPPPLPLPRNTSSANTHPSSSGSFPSRLSSCLCCSAASLAGCSSTIYTDHTSSAKAAGRPTSSRSASAQV